MKKHYHDPRRKNDLEIGSIEARVDGSCKEYAACMVCNTDWQWEWVD